MVKNFLILIILILSLSVLVSAAVDVEFITPTPIVSDVPFNFNIMMNSNSDQVMRIQFYVTSFNNNIIFNSASRSGVWLQSSTVNNNQAKDANKVWWYNIGPKGALNEESTSLKKVLTLNAKATQDDILTLTAQDNVVALYPTGDNLLISKKDTEVKPQISSCGDGVVGYIDLNNNGLKDGGEINEVCDLGSSTKGSGCNDDCDYVKIGYKSSNCAFGSRNCQVIKMNPKELFIAKLTALVNSQCYPNEQHPDVLYCDKKTQVVYDNDGKLDAQNMIRLISQINVALREFLIDTFTGEFIG